MTIGSGHPFSNIIVHDFGTYHLLKNLKKNISPESLDGLEDDISFNNFLFQYQGAWCCAIVTSPQFLRQQTAAVPNPPQHANPWWWESGAV